MSQEPTALSLFSGIGGFCEGVRKAGFKVLGAVELDRFASANYKLNFPDTPLFEGDATDFFPTGSTVLREHREKYLPCDELDLLFGGPPCQGYSQIGPRNVDDPRNDLYLPDVPLGEPVAAEIHINRERPEHALDARRAFPERKSRTLSGAVGYSNLSVKLVDASHFGVPQARNRAIIFAARQDSLMIEAGQAFDAAIRQVVRPGPSVIEAIGDLPAGPAADTDSTLEYPGTKNMTAYQQEMRLDSEGECYTKAEKLSHFAHFSSEVRLHNHHTKEIQDRRLKLIKLLAQGKKADSLPKAIWNNARPEKWRRFHPDLPAHTLLAQMHRDLSEWVHPNYDRWITVREAMRLQSFHDGFVPQ